MELGEFSNMLLHSSHEAKNFMNFLLGYNFSNPDKTEKSILIFFDSLPEDYKKENEVFETVFFKFFQTYRVNENNIKYYDTYIHNKSYKSYIMNKNPNWQWEDTVLEYKSLAEVCKSFKASLKMGYLQEYNIGINFLADHTDFLHNFIPKNYKKSIEVLNNNQVFDFLLKYSYKGFKKFCHEYDLPFQEIFFPKIFCERSSGLSAYLFLTCNKNLVLEDLVEVIQDLAKSKDTFPPKNALFKNKFGETSNKNIADIWLQFISIEKMDMATICFQHFKEEIQQCISTLIGEQITSIDKAVWKKIGEELKHIPSTAFSPRYYKVMGDSKLIDDFFTYYKSYTLDNKLENTLSTKDFNPKRNKI